MDEDKAKVIRNFLRAISLSREMNRVFARIVPGFFVISIPLVFMTLGRNSEDTIGWTVEFLVQCGMTTLIMSAGLWIYLKLSKKAPRSGGSSDPK